MTEKKNYLFDNKALTVLIVPLLLEQLLSVFVGMADSIMIASVGEAAVSGVSLVDNVMTLFIFAFSALATGGAVIAGQYLGQQNEKSSCEAATQMIWSITIMACGITMILYAGKGFILNVLFGSIDADVYYNAENYLLIVTASVPFMALYNAGAAIFRIMGNSNISMKISLLMNAINVIGNALLVFGFHLGTRGVAIPTLVSRLVAAVVITGLLCNQKLKIHILPKWNYQPDVKMIRRIFNIGLPNGLENGAFQLGRVIMLSLVSTFGTSAITANAIGNAIGLFQWLPGTAINLAITTVIARCVGAGDYEQARYYTKKLLTVAYLGLWTINILIVLIYPFISQIYNLSVATSNLTKQIIYICAVSCVTVYPLAFCLPCTLRAAGDAKIPMVISMTTMWLLRIGCGYILGKYFGLGVIGVWIAMGIDWFFRAICIAIRYKQGKWTKIQSI